MLNKMTGDQARWAIQNGDAWIRYLRSQGGEIFPTSPITPRTSTDSP